MSHRSKSNLLPPEEKPAWKEPQSGPGSACCYCRVMDRKVKVREAYQRLAKAVVPEEVRYHHVAPLVARLNRPISSALFRGVSR